LILTRDIDIGFLSVCPMLVLLRLINDNNNLKLKRCISSLFYHMVRPSF